MKRGMALSLTVSCVLLGHATAIAEDNFGECAHSVFKDNFSGMTIDQNLWKVVEGHQIASSADRPPDLEIYSAKAIKTGSPGVRIEISKNNGASAEEYPYMSGRIESKKSFLFGRFEFIARLPSGRGLWPAIWLRTPTGSPLNGEIDLLEGYGSDPGLIQSTLHHWVNGKDLDHSCAILFTNESLRLLSSDCRRVLHPLANDLSSGFHNYAVVWEPNKVTWFFDGKPYYEVASNVARQPMNIVINLAASAAHDGTPDGSLRLPQSLDVKSVDVCQQS